MSQYIKAFPNAGSPFFEVDSDPTFSDVISDGYWSALVYVPSTIIPDLEGGGSFTSVRLLSGDQWLFDIFATGFGVERYAFGSYSFPFGAPAVIFDDWVQFEVHVVAGSNIWDVRINGTLYSGLALSAFWTPSGMNYMSQEAFSNSAVGGGGGTNADDWIGFDELAFSESGWISQGATVTTRWAFESADPIAEALVNYPTPPWYASADAASFVLTGGGGDEADFAGEEPVGDPPDPTACCADVAEIGARIFINGTEVTNVCVAGSWNPQLNRPAQATVTIPMDAAIGDVGDLLRIEYDSGDCIPFHGRILNMEVDTSKDEGRVQYNAQDAMELWQWRPVRDDDGDFSKPRIIEQYINAPAIMNAVLQNTVDSTGRVSLDSLPGGPPPTQAEGPIGLDIGGVATGGPNMRGAPVDWPMRISELFSLLVSTGRLDGIISYSNPGGGVTGRVDFYNGRYGTDRSADVQFQYGMGLYNAAEVRWNRDMTSMVNKYWLYGGPQIATAADPKGDQHWCFNVTGTDGGASHVPPFSGGLAYPPGGQSVDNANNPIGPPWTDNELGEKIYNSRQQYDVRMQVDIFDAYDENCIRHFGTPGRNLYRYQWQVFSWFSATPRELIHITPVPGTEIGCFHIGDFVQVDCAAEVRGGFSGKQRVYGYTVSWEGSPSVLTLSEIQTSADNET